MSDPASSSSIVVCLSLQVLAFRLIVAANWILGQWKAVAYAMEDVGPMVMVMVMWATLMVMVMVVVMWDTLSSINLIMMVLFDCVTCHTYCLFVSIKCEPNRLDPHNR